MPSQIPSKRTVFRRSHGDPPHKLEKKSEAIPTTLQPLDVLIRVHAISLNYRDANMLNGTNPWPILEGGMPCSDAAGEVIAVGPYVTRFKVGDRVCPIVDQNSITGEEQTRKWLGSDLDGILATHIIFDEQRCVKVPDHLSWAEAACLPCAGVTAWSSLVTEGKKLVAGQTVVLQGTGGVSIMALKLAAAAGFKSIITSSSDQKLEHIRKAYSGVQVETINYRTTPDWDQRALHLNGGIGADIILENGGTPSIKQSFNAVKKGGIISQVGYLGKQDAAHLEGLIPLLIDKTVNFRGINVGSRLDFERMNQVIDATKLHFDDIIDKTFAFEQAAEAVEYLWSGKHVGKIVIDVP